MKRIILAMLLVVPFSTISARTHKYAFDERNQLVGISGDVKTFVEGEYTNKFDENVIDLSAIKSEISTSEKFKYKDITKSLNRNHIGKQVLDYLFMYNGTGLSDELLKTRAIKNAEMFDYERAEATFIGTQEGAMTVVKDDYLPVLESNYIYLEKIIDKKIYWAVFHVEIDKKIMDQVYNAWNDLDAYDKIEVKVKCIAHDRIKTKKFGSAFNLFVDDDPINLRQRNISKKVEAFAITGKVSENSPHAVELCKEQGIKKLDRVDIFRQFQNTDSTFYSKKMSSARIVEVTDSNSIFFAFSGKKASFKKGDLAVLYPDKNASNTYQLSILIGNANKSTASSINFDFLKDKRLYMSKSGISVYLLGGYFIGMGLGKKYDDDEGRNKDKIFFNGGINFGLSAGSMLFRKLEVMPYLMAQFAHLNDWSLRLPVGVRFNYNLKYPVQLTLGLGGNIKLTGDDAAIGNSFNISLGWRYCF